MSDAGQGDARRRGWARPALVVSLAVNLLFVGLIAGAMWKRHNEQWRPRSVVLEMTIRQMISELPQEKRAAGEKVLQEFSARFPETYSAIRDLRKKAGDALTADPYDEQSFSDMLTRLREAHDEKRRVRHQAVVDFIRNMTPEERRRFVELYKENRRGPWDRDRFKDGK